MRNSTTFIRQLGLINTSETGGYGALYNWYAASDANFAPSDWKLPTSDETTLLKTYLTNNGYSGVEGGALKEIGLNKWFSPNTNATDAFGFKAIPNGYRLFTNGLFNQITKESWIWCLNTSSAYLFVYNSAGFTIITSLSTGYEKNGFAIRLLYNGAGSPTTVTDYDGNIYDVVQIGSQYWTKQNWKCTHLNNGIEIPEITDNFIWSNLTSGAWCYYNNDPTNL